MKRFILLLALLLSSPAYAASPVVKVLDTAVGENGPTQSADFGWIKEQDYPLVVQCDLSTGDITAFQGRALSTDSWITIYSWTAATDEIKSFRPMPQWRLIRSTDGTSGESVCRALNLYNEDISTHE